MEDPFRIAVDNISRWGDTDVFPLPPENHVFFDRPDEVVKLLTQLHEGFGAWRNAYPPYNESALAMVGYTTFRWVTQLDPLWNAYLLGLVLSVGDKIEQARISRDQRVVFSYRYDYDPSNHRLFADSGWRDFNMRSLELAATYRHVLVCDIADFYGRVYHHNLENALEQLGPMATLPNSEDALPKRVARVLGLVANNRSYGLPVGGPAARILSELLLNGVDRLLLSQNIAFCRFADDYHIFTTSRAGAHEALRFLTEKLLKNEGLSLQRAKTRILTSKDFMASSLFAAAEEVGLEVVGDVVEEGTDGLEAIDRPVRREERSFLSLSLRYDPYSQTAKEDYEELKEQVEKFDIVGMLARELAKTRIHSALTRRLIQAMSFLQPDVRDAAAKSLVDNIETLTPVFPNVMRALTEDFANLSVNAQVHVGAAVRRMIVERPYYAEVPVNLAYAVRLLARVHTHENEVLLGHVYREAPIFVQRDIMVIMARWHVAYWLSDHKADYLAAPGWVRRAFLMASFVLGDGGEHWRRHVSRQLCPFDKLLMQWMKDRVKVDDTWVVPL